ncbi:TnsA endonuclease N-terminal domain-containing protein [Phyllobacterium myrsinacearum]|uniref:TnsA endonuclease N-terminal domain-containing protein n=1 Tax=Phyllobacterium myrsinacearum TaxID=28101 RepID=A0A839EDZ8_9HYPH|nr:TnsA endonuclease N-terminal domain-containing protein [Phyllobacterium myrsinacearum]MBA8878293.1 hypothetical protein [Phyllobacterium myrsinacearum]
MSKEEDFNQSEEAVETRDSESELKPKSFPRRKSGRARAREAIAPGAPREGQLWLPPSASLSTRAIKFRGLSSFRGAMVNPKDHREMHYESTLERDTAYILLANPDITDIRDQPPKVHFFDRSSKPHSHTFDFDFRLKTGERMAIAVKLESQVERSGILETLALIREQRPKGCADYVELRTERLITRIRARNARMIVRAINNRVERNVDAVRDAFSRCAGAIRISDLIEVSVPAGPGFMAILCLIADGIIEQVGNDNLSYDSFVCQRANNKKGE